MKAWGQPTKGRSNGSSVISVREAPTEHNLEVTSKLDSLFAEEVAWRTRELLNSQGWCLWKCSTLGGEVIAVVRDELVKGVPEDYPVYTEAELEELCQDDVNEATIRLVHEAKKLASAKILSGTEDTIRVKPIPTKQEFNIRFLLATQCYMPKVALALIRECREDIELFGLEYAQKKWAKFISCH